MAETVPAPRKTSKARSAATAGYRKGEETRQRILEVALKAFGDASYKVATTRRIAEAAGVSLPTLQYYFGGKEGLYRACAEAIVQRYRRHTQAAAAAAAEALSQESTAETARLHLKAVIRALTGFLVGSREAEGWAQFVARELRDPGPAFTILYENLWRPGVLTTARLMARILGVPEGDPGARIRALLLLSSLLAFRSGRSIALRTMGWSTIGRHELTMVLSGLDAAIDAIGRDLPAC
jgi:TetR/AcrR family transcriptional regulator, regulator of cefoperazone and chloramphenicol sensitivity